MSSRVAADALKPGRTLLHDGLTIRWPDAAPGAEPLLPGQALTLAEALAAYTAGSAYVNHLDETGAVAPGYLADLVVLDRDPFAGPAGEIAAAAVALTYVEGQQVYAAPTA